jgi:3'-phosphoadenosine 5'-phosphosulfate sulfotransferase
MKYIISESRINQIIFAYLDSLNMFKVKVRNTIHFSENYDDNNEKNYSVMRYNTEDKSLHIYGGFIKKLELMFGLSEHEILKIINSWVKGFPEVNVIKRTESWSSQTLFEIPRLYGL